ncbi:putative phosphoketolase [Dictyobacter alpinus]|uniref:Putative phosphoketolase n=1 Tax=Dictyobacter alpinus TaxID=2014873 RepID=A0A402BK87_9CHLR|nr:phosphoketolase family protein [Dictyobacter alpinus]GCE31768.1 putative phosphoketolase [Dictyobacter alpinus]
MVYADQGRLALMHKYWNAANYLTVGQIYLQHNPLLKEPLQPEHIKPRLLGHWGTSPGLSLIYVHLNRLIQEYDANIIYLAGPGHGGPALLANVYLEGTYSEIYPKITPDAVGIQRLFRQFSTPGGVPSHVSVPTPGSIHEGGELGYVLSHAFGAAFDNPDLIVAAVVGDGEAETAPLEGAWKSTQFLNPQRDGAVLPILHLNGYKISGPTVLGRSSDESIEKLLSGHGYDVHFVEGDDPMQVHQDLATTLDLCYAKIRSYQEEARTHGFTRQPEWPAIVLRTPKGWTGPKEVDGIPIEGTFRSHQVPVASVRSNPEHMRIFENWLRSYHPEELFDAEGSLVPELAALAPKGDRRMGANPHANGGTILTELDLPAFTDYAIDVQKPATELHESTRQLGKMLRDIFTRNAAEHNFRLFCPDETNSNRLGNVFEVENRCSVEPVISIDDHVSPDGRVMEVLSEHLCQGWLEGYLLTGRHGLFASYEAFAMVSASMSIQHAKWLEESIKLPWRKPVASLNILLTSTCWRNDHNGFSHQGPGLIDTMLSKKGTVSRIYLPPDANCLLSVADHCLRSHDYVNLIVIDKQPQLQWLNKEDAIDHCTRGLSTWQWASNDEFVEPDVVMACAGDIPTLETIAAAWWLRKHIPELKVRVVNVVDLMTLYPSLLHPHGLDEATFINHFTHDKPVVFAFHGYPRAIHEVVHGRPNAERFHVRGFNEEGTTTTPFDMVVLNGMSRYQLCIEAMRRATRVRGLTAPLIAECNDILTRHKSYIQANLEDLPEVRDWTWTN